MNTKIPSLANVRENIRSKISESYEAMGKKIEENGMNPLYPENPAMDASSAAVASGGTAGKPVTVDSQLLRDLLNWATSADAASIENVVAKAEELGATGPLGSEKLIDLTGAANYQQPGVQTDPAIPGNEVPAVGSEATPGMPVAAGPTGPLSPVMASFIRRGKKVQEAAGPTPRWTAGKMKEDDVISSDNEVIVNPGEMGSGKGELPAGGQTPKGMNLSDPMNKDNSGLKEDGLEDDDQAAKVSAELDAEGGVEGMEDMGGPEVAPGGEEIGIAAVGPEAIGGPEAGIEGEVAEIEPAAGAAGGLVQQIGDLQDRIAELEAIIKGEAVAGAVDAVADAIGGEAGEEGEIDDEDDLEGSEDDSEESEEGEEGEEGEENHEKSETPEEEAAEEAGKEDEEKEEKEEKEDGVEESAHTEPNPDTDPEVQKQVAKDADKLKKKGKKVDYSIGDKVKGEEE